MLIGCDLNQLSLKNVGRLLIVKYDTVHTLARVRYDNKGPDYNNVTLLYVWLVYCVLVTINCIHNVSAFRCWRLGKHSYEL